ncbi:ABC transporter permease [Algiphilus sp.]|uniref:ABC transporter permease n=1 Tax=Algiphilus sp. TaxID=1872431 RepID=UPI0025BACD8D|nr:ABC transporter permease [Algiphilus sp.]MCK5770005.1 ABC transporter permease subunit [Algiphilus sp.]
MIATTLSIAGNEARRIFTSPLAWTVLGVVAAISGYIFVMLLLSLQADPMALSDYMGVSDYISAGVFGFATLLFLLVMPLMTMRLFAEERKTGTITLLLSAPVSTTQIVLGKFLGLTVFMQGLVLILMLMPASLAFSTDLDYGRLAAGVLGMLLMLLAFGAAGLFVSTLTREPTIAAVTGFGLLLMLWLLDVLAYQDVPLAQVFRHLSLIGHYDNLRRGIFDTADIAYYLLFTGTFLWAAVQRLDIERS